MKLSDIYGTEAKYVQHIDNYVHHYQRSKYLNQSYNYLIQTGKYTYNGQMFRALGIPRQKLTQAHDTRVLMAMMHNYANKHQHRTIFAWSKIIGDDEHGMMSALRHQMEYTSMPKCGIIITQTAEGLDINDLFKNDSHHKEMFIKEQEVLAPITNDVNLYGFWFGLKTYTVDEFGDFIADVTGMKESAEVLVEAKAKHIKEVMKYLKSQGLKVIGQGKNDNHEVQAVFHHRDPNDPSNPETNFTISVHFPVSNGHDGVHPRDKNKLDDLLHKYKTRTAAKHVGLLRIRVLGEPDDDATEEKKQDVRTKHKKRK